MTSRLAAWGNSLAIRIPRRILNEADLQPNDEVSLFVNERGNIEMSRAETQHRKGKPAEGVTFESLFVGYEGGRCVPDDAWGWSDDSFVGEEARAWDL